MEIFETAGNDGSVEAGLVSCKGLDVSKVCEQLSSVDELENKIEVSRILGETFEGDDEGVIDL